MFSISQTTLEIITVVTGFLASAMICLFVFEVSNSVERLKNVKGNEAREEVSLNNNNEELLKKIRLLEEENQQLQEEKCGLENEIFRNQLANDELQTEILRIQPDDYLLEENQRLEGICEKLSMKLYNLKHGKHQKKLHRKKKSKQSDMIENEFEM